MVNQNQCGFADCSHPQPPHPGSPACQASTAAGTSSPGTSYGMFFFRTFQDFQFCLYSRCIRHVDFCLGCDHILQLVVQTFGRSWSWSAPGSMPTANLFDLLKVKQIRLPIVVSDSWTCFYMLLLK